MTSPEPTTAASLAEKVARTRHAMTFQAKFGWMAWDEAPAPYRSEAVKHAEEHLAAMAEAGLAVVELPEPDDEAVDESGTARAAFGLVEVTRYSDGMVVLRQGDSVWSVTGAKGTVRELQAGLRWAERQGGDPR